MDEFSSLSYMVDFYYPISISLLLVGASQFCRKNISFFHWLSFSGTTSQSVPCGHFTKGGPFGHLLMKFESQAERLKVVGVDSSSRGRLAEMVHRFLPSSCPGAALELPSFYLSVPIFQVSLRFYTLLHVPTVCF